MSRPNAETLALRTRGEGLIETMHQGAVHVVDGKGQTVLAVGDPQGLVHFRSTLKPFQLLPFVRKGGFATPLARAPRTGRRLPPTYEMTKADLALMMASHSAQAFHTGRLRQLMHFGGVAAEWLKCGVHNPYHHPTHEALVMSGQPPTVLHNNCSGKHVGFLLHCLHCGYDTATYHLAEHPAQQDVRDTLARLLAIEPDVLAFGVDGCSVPAYAGRLSQLSTLFARLANPGSCQDREDGQALALLHEAGTTHPRLVAGDARIDTLLMEAAGGRIFAKIGGAGVFAMAVKPGPDYPDGLGIAFKVACGDVAGDVRPALALAILAQLNLLKPLDHPGLAPLVEPEQRNHTGQTVGRLSIVCFP